MHHSLPEAKNLHGMKKSDIQTLCYQTGGKVVITIAILTVENIITLKLFLLRFACLAPIQISTNVIL